MSFLADLLSRAKQPPTARDVPPNLKDIVQSSVRKSAGRRRIILLSALLAVAVLTGVFLVYFSRTLSEKSAGDISLAPQERTAVPEQAPVAGVETPGGNTPPALPEVTEMKPAPAVVQKEAARRSPESARPSPSEKKPLKADEILPSLEQVIVKQAGPAAQTGVRDETAQDAYLYGAVESEMKHDYHGALGKYKKVLEADSGNYVAMNNIAYLYLKMGLTEEAVEYSRMALEINNGYVPAVINLGIASARSGNAPDAEKYFTQALGLDADNQNALFNLALLYERQTEYLRASEYYSRLFRAGGVSGAIGLARINEKQGNITEALKLYRTAYADSSLDEKALREVKQRIIALSGKVQGQAISPYP